MKQSNLQGESTAMYALVHEQPAQIALVRH